MAANIRMKIRPWGKHARMSHKEKRCVEHVVWRRVHDRGESTFSANTTALTKTGVGLLDSRTTNYCFMFDLIISKSHSPSLTFVFFLQPSGRNSDPW